jgi:hypothetical protein
MSADMYSAVRWLSFGRIIDIPLETCLAVLESWPRTGQDDRLRIGRSLLHWPIDGDRGTRQIEVRLARGPLRPPLRMRLEINRWSSSRTALDLLPDQRIRPAAAYFRAGHLLLDSLTHSLLEHRPARHLDRMPAVPSTSQAPAVTPAGSIGSGYG